MVITIALEGFSEHVFKFVTGAQQRAPSLTKWR